MSRHLRIARGSLVAITFLSTVTLAASPAPMRHARGIAATCTTCHARSDARTPAIAPLEGRGAASIVEAMRAFRAGTREGTVMPQIARGYTDGVIDALAAWFAAQR